MMAATFTPKPKEVALSHNHESAKAIAIPKLLPPTQRQNVIH
jgi:hypothetical protein